MDSKSTETAIHLVTVFYNTSCIK